MVGALSPGEALRRVGAVLVLLLIVPILIAGMIHAVIAPMLVGLRIVAKELAFLLLVVTAITLVGWLILHHAQRRSGTNNKTTKEE